MSAAGGIRPVRTGQSGVRSPAVPTDDIGADASAPTLSLQDVRKVAWLARLDLGDDELAIYTEQFADILGHFRDIDALDLGAVQPMTQPYALVNVLRADVEGACLDRDEVLAAAPLADDGRFVVPPVLGGEP
jgi:aspartyl-tRNA(Asn)/glutamyl-tRNA(Gln) amidotransferase subunit C